MSVVAAPSMARLVEDARQYRNTLAHAVRLGMSVQRAQVLIGDELRKNVSAARATDWHLVCDRLTREATAPATVIFEVREVTPRG